VSWRSAHDRTDRLPRARRRPSFCASRTVALSVALVICLVFAVLAGTIGLAAIVGAYLAGLIVAELSDELELKRDLSPIRALLVPFSSSSPGRGSTWDDARPRCVCVGVAITSWPIVTKLLGLRSRDVGHKPALGCTRRRREWSRG
jgi:hypothetical protein